MKKLTVAAVALAMAGATQAANVTNILENGEVVIQFKDAGSFSWTAPTDCYPGLAPGFVDAAVGDYRLRPGSRCRDKGEKLDWMTAGVADRNANPRCVDRQGLAWTDEALPDLGCYECQDRVPGLLLLVR